MSLQEQLSWSLIFDLIGLHNSYKLLLIDHLTMPQALDTLSSILKILPTFPGGRNYDPQVADGKTEAEKSWLVRVQNIVPNQLPQLPHPFPSL